MYTEVSYIQTTNIRIEQPDSQKYPRDSKVKTDEVMQVLYKCIFSAPNNRTGSAVSALFVLRMMEREEVRVKIRLQPLSHRRKCCSFILLFHATGVKFWESVILDRFEPDLIALLPAKPVGRLYRHNTFLPHYL